MQPQTQLSEARLLELLLHVADNLDDGIIAFDVRCRYILWNRAMERLTGLLPGEVVGRNIFEVFPALRQGGQQKLLQQALAGQTLTSADVPFRVPLEKTGRFEATYFPFKEWGAVAGCVAIVRDLKLQQSVQAAESQRSQSEKRWRSLYEHAPSAVQVFAGDGRLVAVNPAFERLFGITREQLADYNILEDQQLVTAGTMRQVESVFRGEAQEWPELMSTIDRGPLTGQTRWTRSFMYPVMEDGAVREVVWCREDITAQKQAQAALLESESRFRRAHQTAKIGAYELDLRSRQLRWFVEMPALAGLGGDGNLDVWLRHMPSDDRARLQHGLDALLAGRGEHMEVCLDRPNGARIWLRCGGEVIPDHSGEATHVVGVALDITATRAAEQTLRESEERLRFMVGALPQIAWIAGPHGEPEFHNERWFSFVGMREDTLEPWNWSDFEHPQDQAFHAAAWQRALSLGERFEVEVRLRRGADQSYRWHLLRALPMRDDAGRVTRWFGTATDVHELKMANEELRLGRERLRLAQAAGGTGLWEFSLESRELTYSTEFAEMMGLTIGGTAAFDELISRMSSPAEQQQASKALQRVLRSHKDLRVEFFIRRGGEARRMMLRGEVVQWLGKPMIIGIAMDVTAAAAEHTVPSLVPARAKKSANKSEEKKSKGLRAAAG